MNAHPEISRVPEVNTIKNAIKRLEKTLNDTVQQFQDESGIPVLIEVTEPRSQYIGQKPIPTIKVSAFIYDPL